MGRSWLAKWRLLGVAVRLVAMRPLACTPILLLCLFIGVISCKENKQSKPVGDGAAGKVIAIEGTVTASRPGEKARTLAFESPIFANDTVQTSTDGAVAIYLNHNHAIHDIGGNQSIAIEGSLAWKASTQSTSVFDPSVLYQGNGAAGANAEKRAAEIPSQLRNEQEEQPEVFGYGGDAGGFGMDGDGRKDGNKRDLPTTGEGDGPGPAEPTKLQAKEPVATPAGDAVADQVDDDDDDDVRQDGESRESPPATWPLQKQEPTKSRSAVPNSEDPKAAREAGAREIGETKAVKKPLKRANTTKDKKSKVTTKRGFVLRLAKACQEKHKGEGDFQVQISFEKFKVTIVTTTGPEALAATLSCLEDKLKATSGAYEAGTITFALTL
jgi:hypothetical protein